jgi:hypothetical protein
MTDTASKSNDTAAKPQLTRIPLDAVWFPAEEPMDLPGGNAIQPMLNFGLPKVKGRQYFLGYFVPSYQVVDIEWYRKEGDEAEYFSIPMSAVKKIKRSSKKA